MWFVYIIQSQKDNSIYTGITTDINRRLNEHNSGKGAKYTRSRIPFVLLKYFECNTRSEALKLEYRIKQLSHKEKLSL